MDIGRLTALKVQRAKVTNRKARSQKFADGSNLYLQVTRSRSDPEVFRKSWTFRYVLNHAPEKWMGLGSANDFSLAEARERAKAKRQLLADGIDPIAAREREAEERKIREAAKVTFREAATRYIAAHRAGWKNEKHKAQWEATLETYVYPTIGRFTVDLVNVDLVRQVLQQKIKREDGPALTFWEARPETARRVRGRIESVLDWAKALGYRQGDNPAQWSLIKNLLPKVGQVEHHAALPFAEMPSFMSALRDADGTAARALELLILTATRTSETLGARWKEFDLQGKAWTIPPARMKSKREQRIPLSTAALSVLKGIERSGDFVFPGAAPGKSLSNMSLLMTLRRMGRDDFTVHGFRSAFRDWVGECTSYPRELAEAALAHKIGDKVERAYARGDLFERRREMMEAWASYCAPQPDGKVVGIGDRRAQR